MVNHKGGSSNLEIDTPPVFQVGDRVQAKNHHPLTHTREPGYVRGRKGLIEAQCVEIFAEVSKGLVDTDIEKFNALSEGIEFEDEEQYREKLNLLKESYFDKSNPGVWTHQVHDLLDRNRFTPWREYSNDTIIKENKK